MGGGRWEGGGRREVGGGRVVGGGRWEGSGKGEGSVVVTTSYKITWQPCKPIHLSHTVWYKDVHQLATQTTSFPNSLGNGLGMKFDDMYTYKTRCCMNIHHKDTHPTHEELQASS